MVGLRMTGQSALIVIDAQDAVLETAWDRDGVVARIGALADRARREGVPVVYVQHEVPAHPTLAPGGAGWRIDDRIAPRHGDWLIGTQYPDAFASTALADTLDAMDVTHLVVTGARTDEGIEATVHRAIIEGWHVTLAGDCHTTADRVWATGRLAGEQIVSHTNQRLALLEYPGRVVEVVTHDQVTFSVAAMQGAA